MSGRRTACCGCLACAAWLAGCSVLLDATPRGGGADATDAREEDAADASADGRDDRGDAPDLLEDVVEDAPGEEAGPEATFGFVYVPAGEFDMGSPLEEPGREEDESPHHVTLSTDFEMMAQEVPQWEFSDRMGRNPSGHVDCIYCPVETVSWHEALDYANALSAELGKTPCFDCQNSRTQNVTCALKSEYTRPQECPGFRLPTEAEWEYAARAGTTTTWPCGDSSSCLEAMAWYNAGDAGITHGGCEKAFNAWDLCDMIGNVWEWVWDWYVVTLEVETDPYGPVTGDGTERAMRGCDNSVDATACRVANRDKALPSWRGPDAGFRLVRSLLPE